MQWSIRLKREALDPNVSSSKAPSRTGASLSRPYQGKRLTKAQACPAALEPSTPQKTLRSKGDGARSFRPEHPAQRPGVSARPVSQHQPAGAGAEA